MERLYLGAVVESVAGTAAGGSVTLGEVALSASGCAFPDFATLSLGQSPSLCLFRHLPLVHHRQLPRVLERECVHLYR